MAGHGKNSLLIFLFFVDSLLRTLCHTVEESHVHRLSMSVRVVNQILSQHMGLLSRMLHLSALSTTFAASS